MTAELPDTARLPFTYSCAADVAVLLSVRAPLVKKDDPTLNVTLFATLLALVLPT